MKEFNFVDGKLNCAVPSGIFPFKNNDVSLQFIEGHLSTQSFKYNVVTTDCLKKYEHLFKKPTIINDYGGSGDCFFRCIFAMNEAYQHFGLHPLHLSIVNYYSLLGLENGTYIEDTHISQLAIGLTCVFVIISEVGEKSYFSVFGTLGPVYCLYNVSSYHYLGIYSDSLIDDLLWRRENNFYSEGSQYNALSNYLIEARGSEPEECTKFQDCEQEIVEDKVKYYATLIPTNNPAILYSYLLDVNKMYFPDVSLVLENFYHVHGLIVSFLSEVLEKESVVHPDFMKAYYKFRHNTFAYLCLSQLSDSVHAFETDVEIKKWIPSSDKTPDFVLEDEKTITLFEFTVGNTYERIDFYKGGGVFTVKYSEECKLIQEVTGKLTRSVIVPGVLNSYNMREVSEIVKGDADFVEILRLFYTYANRDKHIVSTSNFDSNLLKNVDMPLIPDCASYPRGNLPDIVMLPADVVSGLASSMNDFITRLTTSPSTNYIYYYNLKTHRLNMRKSDYGHPPDYILKKINSDFTTLIPYLHFYDGSDKLDINNIRGTVPVTILGKRTKTKIIKWDYIPQITEFYSNTKPEYVPEYGELKEFTEDNVIPLCNLSKVNFPPDYFSNLCQIDTLKINNYSGNKMLFNCTMGLESVLQSVQVFNENMQLKNQVSHIKSKPTFLLPIPTTRSTPSSLGDLSELLIDTYLSLGRGEYTKNVLRKAKNKNYIQTEKIKYSESVRVAFEKYHEINSEYHKTMKSICGRMCTFKELDAPAKKQLQPLLAQLNLARKNYRCELGSGKSFKGERLVAMARGRGSNNNNDFDKEMKHYGSDDSDAGIGLDANNSGFGKYLKRFIDRLFIPDFHQANYPKLYSDATDYGPEFLTKGKKSYIARFDEFYENHFQNTLLEQITFFIQNLSSHLFNESLKTYNSGFVKVDNLGTSNAIVLCRGGPKIYKNQRSRLFKCIFTIDSADLPYSGYLTNSNFEVFHIGDQVIISTPWSQVHQDVLFDYLSLSYKTFNQLYSCYTRQFEDFTNPVPRISVLPFILSLHNRRKTEKFMHNSRYLIVNPLGISSNLTGIMDGFADKNYTYLDSYLRNQISEFYVNFASCLLEIRNEKTKNIDVILDRHKMTDLWLNEPIPNADILTLFIYITYMMTKAPVNASIEQANNLWEILEDVNNFSITHPTVDGLKDESLRFDILKFDDKIYDDDFKYDPVFCQYLGHHMAGYLSNSFDPGEIQNKWSNIIQSDVDNIANSNGLRGFNQKNFFSKKGYEVVYDKVEELLGDRELDSMVEDYLSSHLIDSVSKIRSDRLKIQDIDIQYEKLVFHVVHKIQRGGGREIFCMDLNTKAAQNPIEKLLKFICGKVPNEFISIKSNKRHSIIHTDFYEKPVGKWVKQVVRWVLDCRRWAPHSIFQKYIHFISGLAPMLPPDFLEHFTLFSKGMFSKKFITREHVISKMRNNIRFEKFKDIPEKFEKVADAYCFTVQFSFVMGIFNYLSTLLHAANQIVASEVIRNNCLSKGLGLVILDPKCHSDDSVVSSYHENSKSVGISVKLYDWFLKGANHMLSIKKSQINNNVYLEFLSVLYLFDRFVPVFPKFISTIPFKPSDEGYSSDISFACSQAIELISNGGSHEEAYLIMKTTAKYISKVYNLPFINGLPPNFFGEPDSHPIELLFSGAEADLFRFFKYQNNLFWEIFNLLSDSKLMDEDNPNFNFNWDMNAMLTNKQKDKMSWVLPILNKYPEINWTVKNNKLGNGFLNLIWYYNKLTDRKFASSLTQEPESRRFSRIFGAGGYRRLKDSEGGFHSVTDVIAVIKDITTADYVVQNDAINSYINYMASPLFGLYESLIGTEIVNYEISNLKDKPIVFRTGASHLGNVKMSANEYVTYIKEPNAYKLLGKMSNPSRESEIITETLNVLNMDPINTPPDLLFKAVSRLLNFQEKSFRLVASIPGDSKLIDNMSSTLSYICHTARAHHKMIVKNKSAHEYDWSKKMVSGTMPNSAKEYIKTYWVCKLLNSFNILQLDIYNEDLIFKEKNLANQLPGEWKVILTTSLQDKDDPLESHNHWIYWEKEQIKLGHRWIGEGSCTVKIPEATMRIIVANSKVRRLEISTMHHGLFSASSSWYLNNILKFSGINADFLDPDYQPPNQMYLGYILKEKLYGYGRPRMFDYVLDNVIAAEDPTPSDFYQKMNYRIERNHYIYYQDNREYYIDFFVPTEDPVSISFKGIFDLEKLREHAENLDVRRFIKQASVDLGGYVEIDKKYLLDNIGSSLLYNVIFSGPDRQNLIQGTPEKNYLISAVTEWKKTYPDFGFPNEQELEYLIKSEDVPPFPNNIMGYLLKLGKTTLTDNEFRMILTNLTKLRNEDKLKYLQNNFGYMDSSMRSEALVISVRSKIIFNSCAMIGVKVLPLLVPLTNLIVETIRHNNLNVRSLDSIKNILRFSKNKKYSNSEIMHHIFCKMLMEGVYMNIGISKNKTVQLIKQILKEYWPDMKEVMNLIPFVDPILNTVDFNVEWNIFWSWFKHLINAHFRVQYKKVINVTKGFKLNVDNNEMKALASVKRTMSRYDLLPNNQLILLSKDGQRGHTIKLPLEVGQPGICKKKFFILTEDAQEEFNDGYSFDSDAEEYAEEDEEAKIKNLGYVFVPNLDLISATGKRGTAANVFYKTHSISRDILRAYGEKIVFKREQQYENIVDYLKLKNDYVVYLGGEKTHLTVEGYKKLSWEDTMHEIREDLETICSIEINGKLYNIEELETNSELQVQLMGFDNYFKNLKTATEEVKRVRTLIDAYSMFEKNPQLEESINKLETFKSKVENIDKQAEEQKTKTIKEIFEEIDTNTLFRTVSENAAQSGIQSSEVKQYFKNNYQNFSYQEPLNLLTDLRFRSEFNSIIPGYLDLILNGEVKLSVKTKNRIMRYGQGQIAQMPKEMRPKYRKLLFIIKAILTEIYECNFLENEDLKLAALLDDYFTEALDNSSSDENEIVDLLPEMPDSLVKIDIEKIF